MSFKLDYDSSSLKSGLDKMAEKMGALLLMYAATKAKEIEFKMKANRKWTDRTGMAKATLKAVVSQPDDTTIRITLSHGVNYGIWLELANEKKYAIISPTVKAEGPKIVEDLNDLMSKINL